MFFTVKRIKGAFFITLACCSGIYTIQAMEQLTLTMEKEEQDFFTPVPAEIKAHIITFLQSAKNLGDAIKNIKSFSLTSKEFHDFINDPQILGNLIEELSKRFNTDSVEVALAFGNPSAVQWLKTDIDKYSEKKANVHRSLVIYASILRNILNIQFLFKAGADVNTVDVYGKTPLIWCIQFGHKDIVKLLLQAGADVNKADNYGNTPLTWASYYRHKEIVELLLKAGAKKASNNAHLCIII